MADRNFYSFYFASSRTKDWEKGRLIVSWWATKEQATSIAEGMCASLHKVSGYAHGKVKAYLDGVIDFAVSF